MSPESDDNVSLIEAEPRFGEMIERATVEKRRVVLTSDGSVVAAIVPAEDLALLEEMEDLLDAAELRAAFEQFERSGEKTLSLDKVIERLGLRP